MRIAALIVISTISSALLLCAADERFTDHGVPAPVTTSRGSVATLDKDGTRILFINLSDIGKVLIVDIDAGKTREMLDIPRFPSHANGFALLHSGRNRFYFHVGQWAKNGRFYEVDLETGRFTFDASTEGTYAMSFHEDREGLIWAALYPHAELVCFNPETKALTSYGALNEETWPQYPRSGMARDRDGWIYVIIGFTKSQILAFDPASGTSRRLLAAEKRAPTRDDAAGVGRVFLAADGEVYGETATDKGWTHFRLAGGQAFELSTPPSSEPVRERAASSWRDFSDFPDGSRIGRLEVPFKRLTVIEADGSERQCRFAYAAPGAKLMNVFRGPGGEIYGSTAYPRFVFRFAPESNRFFRHPDTHAGGHWNAWVTRGQSIYGAFYPWGMIREIDTTQPWTREEHTRLTKADYGKQVRNAPHIHRPNALLLLADGRRMLLAGTPDYGHTGGGLALFDALSGDCTTLGHEALIPEQSTVALANLPDGRVFGVTSLAAGTGGQAATGIPQFYVFDPDSREIVWQQDRPHARGDTSTAYDVVQGPGGLLYLLDGKQAVLYTFDPASRKVAEVAALGIYGTVAHSAGMGRMQPGDDGALYILFARAIVRVTPGTQTHEKLADLPVAASGAMAVTPERIYFSSGAHLWSYRR